MCTHFKEEKDTKYIKKRERLEERERDSVCERENNVLACFFKSLPGPK